MDQQNRTGVSATVASNIALIKYWGKDDLETQWPSSDSLSMTLKNSVTETHVSSIPESSDHLVLVDDLKMRNKILSHLNWLSKWSLLSGSLKISTKNTFPTACGIASSASGMGALTIGAIASWTNSNSMEELAENGWNLNKLSTGARMGSGSACRSLFPGFVHWSRGDNPENQRVKALRTSWQMADIIVVVDDQPKNLSSSEAHKRVTSSPYYQPRVAVVPERIDQISQALSSKDWSVVGNLMESEALELHAIMRTSQDSHDFWHAMTEKVIVWVRQWRQKFGCPAYFTLDAGPNVHILCPLDWADRLEASLKESFSEVSVIKDQTGHGPQLKPLVISSD